MEFKYKAMPATPMSDEEMRAHEAAVNDAGRALDHFSDDELEQYTATMQAEQAKVVELLWDSLKRDPEHADRRQTGWGTKTQAGLSACVYRIGRESAAYQGMLKALKGVLHHDAGLKDQFKAPPALIAHIRRAIAAAE